MRVHHCLAVVAVFALAWASPVIAQNASGGPASIDLTPYARSSDLSGYAPKNGMGQVGSMAGGVAPSIIGILNSNVTASSTSDTNCYGGTVVGAGVTIPATGPYTANTYRLLCSGVYTIGVSVSSATIKVKFGSATVASATTASLPISVTNLPFMVEVRCTIRTAGASGGMVCSGSVIFAITSTTVTTVLITSGATPIAIDTTVANAFQITSALTSIVGSPSITATGGSVEILY